MKNNPLELAKKITSLASEIKAIDPVILDLEGISSFTDFFVVCSATSDRQTRAICDKVEMDLKKEAIRPNSVEGYDQGAWIIVDYFDVVLHIFTEEVRKQYDLEGFWQKAKRVKTSQKKSRPKASIKKISAKAKKVSPAKKKK
ncbi:MAG: ribosome silencing factor [Deltaproteobacteria bacterium]|nr:ribosome silencing factor [Deltaproteobacteria bacterium]